MSKNKPGPKPNNALKSSTDYRHEELKEIRAKRLHGARDWRIKRLRELIEEDAACAGSRLPDNHLTARLAEQQAKAQATGYALLDEITSLWNKLRAEFERAVLDGDADWFKRQRDMLARPAGKPVTARRENLEAAIFEAAVLEVLEVASLYHLQSLPASKRPVLYKTTDDQREVALAKAKRKKPERQRQAAALGEYLKTPKGRSQQRARQAQAVTNREPKHRAAETVVRPLPFTPQQILDALDKREEKNGAKKVLYVEGWRLESARRARAEITEIAKKCGYQPLEK